MLDRPSVEFLPRNLSQIAAENAQRFKTADPFPHIVLDNLFDDRLLSAVIAEFPRPDAIEWERYRNQREVKLAASRDEHFGPTTKSLLYHLNSATFLTFLSELTGIKNLISDPFFEGGGMHQIERGGKLAIHADFNKLERYRLDRRLNALLYLNKDWNDEYGGHLELWDPRMTRCAVRVAPIFNRLVVFATTDFSYHGHPDVLTCPEGMTRKSLALYYYSNGRPAHETSPDHTTLFQHRPGENMSDGLKSRTKELLIDLLPPALTRVIAKAMYRISSQTS